MKMGSVCPCCKQGKLRMWDEHSLQCRDCWTLYYDEKYLTDSLLEELNKDYCGGTVDSADDIEL